MVSVIGRGRFFSNPFQLICHSTIRRYTVVLRVLAGPKNKPTKKYKACNGPDQALTLNEQEILSRYLALPPPLRRAGLTT
jgi:hypothetical protein